MVSRTSKQITYVTDRPGHDRRYAIDATQDRALSWAGSRQKPSKPASARPCSGIWIISLGSTNIQSGSYREWVEKNYAGRSA